MQIHDCRRDRLGLPEFLNRIGACAALLLATSLAVAPVSAQTRYQLGRVPTPAEVASWDMEVAPDGKNLPAAEGTVQRGREVYDSQCAACHGTKGEGAIGDQLAGGQGTLATPKPVRTVGSFWPYATTLFDYIRRAMPLNAPQSLSDADVYAVSGYVLFLNGLLPQDATVDGKTLTSLRMPNRDGFISDSRPDVKASACMKDCKQ
jgi:mono/diheme cytochrome c family protein